MSASPGSFVELARNLSDLLPSPRFDSEGLAHVDAGRLIAQELVDALRQGDDTADLLFCALTLVGKGGLNSETRLLGFVRGLEQALRDSRAVA